MAAPGTAWADPRASSVSRVAPARHVGVSDVLFFDSDALRCARDAVAMRTVFLYSDVL